MDRYTAQSFSCEKLTEELGNSSSLFYFAVQDDEIIGYVKMNLCAAQTELQDDRSLEIERIYVLGEFQGHGFGAQILEKAVQQAQKRKLDYVWLGVWEHNNGAIAFYERNGFYKFGEHPFVLGQDVQTDYLMRKDILY